MWHHKLRKGGLTKTLLDIGSGENAGIGALSEDLTINGQTVTNTFRYEGRNATTGLWTATTGENLTGQGSGGSVGLDTPLPGLTDKAVKGDSTRNWGPGSTIAQGTNDRIYEAVFKLPLAVTASEAILATRTSEGTLIRRATTTDDVQFYVEGASGNRNAQANCGNGVWVHGFFVCDHDSQNAIYIDGDLGGTSLTTALGAITDDFGPRINDTAAGDITIAYLAMWEAASGWLDTHLQAAVAQERFARLTGVYSDRYGGPDHSLLRNSVATLEKQSIAGPQKLFTVGPRWSRIERVPDIHNRYASGLRSEASHTNHVTYSEQLDHADWTKGFLTIDPDSAIAPNGEQTADTVQEDGTTNNHSIRGQYLGHAGGDMFLGWFIKPINRQFCRLQIFSATDLTDYVTFDLTDGNEFARVGAGVLNSGSRYLGDGWHFLWMTANRPTAETQYCYVYVIDDDGLTANFAGLSQDSFYAWGALFVSGLAHPVSYIKTEGAAVARLADFVQYDASEPSLPANAMTAVMDLLAETDGSVSNFALEVGDTTSNNRFLFYQSSSGGGTPLFFGSRNTVIQWSISASGNDSYRNRVWTEHRGVARPDEARYYIDQVSKGSDLSCLLPDSMNEITVGASLSGTAHANGLLRCRLFSAYTTDKDITDFGDIVSKASGYISTPAAVGQSTSYANVGGTFTSVDLSEFTLSAAGVLTYTGTDTKRFVVSAAMSGSISSGTPEVSSVIEKNGVEVASTVSKRDVGGSGIGAWAVQGDIELANGDTINFATKVDSGTPNLTMEAMSIIVHEYP